MCPPSPFKRGKPNFENFKRSVGGRPEKKIRVEEKRRGGNIFKMKGGKPTFQVNLGIEKEKNWRLLQGNLYKFLKICLRHQTILTPWKYIVQITLKW